MFGSTRRAHNPAYGSRHYVKSGLEESQARMRFGLDPHVAGRTRRAHEMDTSVRPPIVTKLVYELDLPGADDLIAAFPVYLAAERMRCCASSERA